MISHYPHWGACTTCNRQRDLNENLNCEECQKHLDNASGIIFVKITDPNPYVAESYIDRLKIELNRSDILKHILG